MIYSSRQSANHANMQVIENTNNIVFDLWQPYDGLHNHTSQEEITGIIDLTSFNHAKSIVTVNNSQYAREIITSGPYTTNPTTDFATTPSTLAYDDTFNDGIFDIDISSINSGVIGYMHYTDGTKNKHCTLTLSASWLE